MTFTVTPIYALAAAIIYMVLWMRVTAKRGAMGQSIGDGGDADLLLRIRQHGKGTYVDSFSCVSRRPGATHHQQIFCQFWKNPRI